MYVEYDLGKMEMLDSLHDFRVSKIELVDNQLVFRYDEVYFYKQNYQDGSEYYERHKEYKSCNIIFQGSNDSQFDVNDSTAEIRIEKGQLIKAKIYDIHEFLDFIKINKCEIETLYFYAGYNTVIINCQLWYKNSKKYGDCCDISITAEKVVYEWK